MASGEDVLRLSADEFEVMAQTTGVAVKALKHKLRDQLGISRFRQRILAEGRELRDSDTLSLPMELELVLLFFCPADEAQCRELYAAVAQDSVERLEEALARPQDPDATSGLVQPGNRTALHYAAVCGSAGCMNLLLEAGADKDRASDDGHTAPGSFLECSLILKRG